MRLNPFRRYREISLSELPTLPPKPSAPLPPPPSSPPPDDKPKQRVYISSALADVLEHQTVSRGAP